MGTITDREWDVVVVGGGVGAVMAGIAAAKAGARTLLIERGGRLGGAGTASMVQPYLGWQGCRHAWIDHVLTQLDGENAKLHDLVLAEELIAAGATLLLHTWCLAPLMAPLKADGKVAERVAGVRIVNKDGEQTVRARIVIDASGDGDIAAGAGVPFAIGRDGDNLMQPMTIMYEIGGVAENAFLCMSEEGVDAGLAQHRPRLLKRTRCAQAPGRPHCRAIAGSLLHQQARTLLRPKLTTLHILPGHGHGHTGRRVGRSVKCSGSRADWTGRIDGFVGVTWLDPCCKS